MTYKVTLALEQIIYVTVRDKKEAEEEALRFAEEHKYNNPTFVSAVEAPEIYNPPYTLTVFE